jgi:hypothetical protein
VFRPNIDTENIFSQLLQAIHKEEPDLLASAVARGVHDKLNRLPGGLPVQNEREDMWTLSGDTTLKAARPDNRTLEISRAAVAQSQLNVITAFKSLVSLAYTVLFKKVWDFTPKLDTTGTPQLKDAIGKGRTPTLQN